jgi:hypothetical protein
VGDVGLSVCPGDRIKVLDYSPATGREKWQGATVEHVDPFEIGCRLDALPDVLTIVQRQSDYWRAA